MAEAYVGFVNLTIGFLVNLLFLYGIVVFAWVVLSWLVAFNVINTYQPLVRSVLNFLHAVTAPALRPIQRFVPLIGGIDISPLVLLLFLQFLSQFLEFVLLPLLI